MYSQCEYQQRVGFLIHKEKGKKNRPVMDTAQGCDWAGDAFDRLRDIMSYSFKPKPHKPSVECEMTSYIS